ncbi:MAG: F-type H+-transporting ATPase subunit a [Actinomycetota bacterium]|jgi:F-type H+-transporting ATPase subunit a|nr:F-type H+-transporting ATPase subunit a [Actinomycetota bacterium]
MIPLVGLEFPPIGHLVEWKGLFLEGTPFEVNKVVILMWVGVLLVAGLFLAAGRRAKKSTSLVPAGIQHVAESGIEFVQRDIILQTMGKEGMAWAPFLTTMFFFIFVTNLFEVVPGVQFPVNARMALPIFLAIVVWFIYNIVGIKSQGLGGYLKSVVMPPGVPKGILPLVALIEFISTFIVRPFSLAVRLFANMLAGHLLLVTFAVLSAALFTKTLLAVILPLPFIMLILLTGFEILVAGLQAFIFTILTAVYIGGAMHPEH